MDKILGLDPGSNSLGTTVRDIREGDLQEQLIYYSVDTFESALESGGQSKAATRSSDKRKRRQYDTRRQRLWKTLDLLIKHHLCPLAQEELDAWRFYDKKRNYFRKYPVGSAAFSRWIKLDFDGDGKPDFETPFELRHQLATVPLDFTVEANRYMLGRAIYHIAQHRGFRSSKKGLTAPSDEVDGEVVLAEDITVQLAASEEKKKGKIDQYMKRMGLETVGSAYHFLLTNGEVDEPTGYHPIRIRASEYQVVRQQLKDEIRKIFDKQNLSSDQDLLTRLLSEKEGKATLFFNHPPRIAKGSIGKCTLETNKQRCLESHPEFEKFRAWQFINNIRVRDAFGKMTPLPLNLRERLYREELAGHVNDFSFKTLRKVIEQELQQEFFYDRDPKVRTISHADDFTVPACVVTKRLKELFGENWETFEQSMSKGRKGRNKNVPAHQIIYSAMDVWHQCLSIDSTEELEEYAQDTLGWTDEDRLKALKRLWSAVTTNRCMLSHKALKNINRFLTRGLMYSDAVLFAKVPDIVGEERWKAMENRIWEYAASGYSSLKDSIAKRATISSITNRLIADFKTQTEENRNKDKQLGFEKTLNEDDHRKVLEFTVQHFGKQTWNNLPIAEQHDIESAVCAEYEVFFQSPQHDYQKMPRLGNELAQILSERFFPEITADDFKKRLYHPSQIAVFQPIEIPGHGVRLGSPSLGNIKNPVYMRAMHIIRRKINALLDAGIIDVENTRVVIELPREMNDANQRKAYKDYQDREKEEHDIVRAILEKKYASISGEDVDKVRLMLHSNPHYIEQTPLPKCTRKEAEKQYRTWIGEGGICYYTGIPIHLEDLFPQEGSEPHVDIEHTIPRSILPDNTMMNQTLCFSRYNRFEKGNTLPALLPEFEKLILPRLQPIAERIERIKDVISVCKGRSKNAQEKQWKDYWIAQRHVWEMDLEYWQGKYDRFLTKEVTDGFRRSQLTDTAIIAKYAAHYLKSIFSRVDIQKGRVTAMFRQILGFQNKNEEKDRTNHYHHAIDSTVLTLIPVVEQRDRMIELFYKMDEAKDGQEYEALARQMDREIRNCHLARSAADMKCLAAGIEKTITESVLVSRYGKDRTLKNVRKRVKTGQKSKITDGKRIPLYSGGDSIRLDLNKDSTYGAILGNEGKIVLVKRESLLKVIEKGKIDDIVDSKVKSTVLHAIAKGAQEGLKPLEVAKQGIWMSSKRADKNGKPIQPIRHVRCKTSNVGFSKAVPVSEHLHHAPGAEHKFYKYAVSGGNPLAIIYERINRKGQVDRRVRFITAFELAQQALQIRSKGKKSIQSVDDIVEETGWRTTKIGNSEYLIWNILKPGYRFLLPKNADENLKGLTQQELLERLYVIKNFNGGKGTTCNFEFTHHASALAEPKPLSFTQLLTHKVLFEHIDFEIEANIMEREHLFKWK